MHWARKDVTIFGVLGWLGAPDLTVMKQITRLLYDTNNPSDRQTISEVKAKPTAEVGHFHLSPQPLLPSTAVTTCMGATRDATQKTPVQEWSSSASQSRHENRMGQVSRSAKFDPNILIHVNIDVNEG